MTSAAPATDALLERDRWSRERLLAFPRERLRELPADAVSAKPTEGGFAMSRITTVCALALAPLALAPLALAALALAQPAGATAAAGPSDTNVGRVQGTDAVVTVVAGRGPLLAYVVHVALRRSSGRAEPRSARDERGMGSPAIGASGLSRNTRGLRP